MKLSDMDIHPSYDGQPLRQCLNWLDTLVNSPTIAWNPEQRKAAMAALNAAKELYANELPGLPDMIPDRDRTAPAAEYRGNILQSAAHWLYTRSVTMWAIGFGHSGSDGTHAWAFPEEDAIVVYLTQSRGNLTGLRVEEALAEVFFGDAFDIRLEDGTAAHTACTAFGLERWLLAVLVRHGPDAAAWPHFAGQEVMA